MTPPLLDYLYSVALCGHRPIAARAVTLAVLILDRLASVKELIPAAVALLGLLDVRALVEIPKALTVTMPPHAVVMFVWSFNPPNLVGAGRRRRYLLLVVDDALTTPVHYDI